MKECEKYAALLDAFSEGDLFLEDMVQVQNHLMTCPDCQAYLEDLMAMRAAFPTVEETEVPEGFADRVMAAVAEHPRTAAPKAEPKKKNPVWRKVLVPLAACCAVVILLGRTAISGGSSKEAAVMSAQSRAETTEECAVAEECAAEEPKAKGSNPAETTEDAAEAPAAAYDGAMKETAPETEMAVNDSYSYTADMKSETVTIGGEEYTQVTVTTEETAAETEDASPEEAEPPLLRDGSEFVLTAAEVGDLLQDFTPDAETETEALYLLSAHDYIALLTALPREVRQSAPANAAETMRVMVLK